MSCVKAENFLQLVAEREMIGMWHVRRILCEEDSPLLRWTGPQATIWGEWSPEAGSSQQPQPARSQRLQSCNHKEVNSANHWNELQSGFFPKAFRQQCSPANTLSSALWGPEQRTQWSLRRLHNTLMLNYYTQFVCSNLLHRHKTNIIINSDPLPLCPC